MFTKPKASRKWLDDDRILLIQDLKVLSVFRVASTILFVIEAIISWGKMGGIQQELRKIGHKSYVSILQSYHSHNAISIVRLNNL
jgi:hypothetical protein